MRLLKFVPVASLPVGLLACRGAPTWGQDPSPDDDCPAQVQVDPNPLSLGTLDLMAGDAATTSALLSLENVGCADLHLEALRLEAGDQGFEVGTPLSVMVEPDRDTSAVVDFTAMGSGTWTDRVVVGVHDLEELEVAVMVQASVVAAEAQVSLDAPLEPVQGCADTTMVRVENVGNAALEVSSLSLFPEGTAFSLAETELPWLLEPGEDATVELGFASEGSELEEVLLEVHSNDPFAPEHLVKLSAQALPETLGHDVFVQASVPPTDIVLFIDQTPSMKQHFDDVVSELGDLMERLALRSEADFRLWAPPSGGCMSTDDLILESGAEASMADPFLEDFPTSGAYQDTERTMMEFNSWLQTALNGCNEGRLREEAILQLLSISDELDQSQDTGDELVMLQEVWGRPEDVVINGVGGTLPDGCQDFMANSTLAPVIEETGGVYADFCFEGWGLELEGILEASLGRVRSFPLSQPAIPGTVEVRVDGVVQATGWTYDETAQAVVFDPVLAAGAEVEVDYVVVPECG